jgi:hypothetical protein
MSVQAPHAPEAPRARTRRSRPLIVLAVSVAVAVVVAVVLVAVQLFQVVTWQRPEFPSLAANPDPSLHGTVAYLSDSTNCVHVVAAAGRPDKEVYCLPEQDVKVAERLGKEQGPQLVWRDDGRLEVTMFRMTDPPGPSFNPGWQRIVDVRTGAVEDVPAADVPTDANRGTHPMVNAAGQELELTSADGDVELTLVDDAGSRTLLSVDGNPEAGYRVPAAFWAPDGTWVAADDGRILVIVPSDPPVVRVLTGASSQGRFDGELSRFAVSDADLLAPE